MGGLIGSLVLAFGLLFLGMWRCVDLSADGPFGLLIGVGVLLLCAAGAFGIAIGGVLAYAL